MKTIKNSPLYWLAICGLIIFLQQEYNNHSFNIICLLAFPVLYNITTWHTIPASSKRIQQAVLISLVSFCMFGEKSLFSFMLPFIASFMTYITYIIMEKYIRKI